MTTQTQLAKCIYLHGFASGPSSTKAKFFQQQLTNAGIPVEIPDLNGADFSDLTITSQLDIVRQAVKTADANHNKFLVGSSMGGLLATLIAHEFKDVRALILLAPGFGLGKRWSELLGAEGVANWKTKGTVDVFHHQKNSYVALKYDFLLDASKYQTDDLRISIPTLVFHGERDETVPLEESIQFARINPDFVELHILDDDHQLIEPLDHIWNVSQEFLRNLQLV